MTQRCAWGIVPCMTTPAPLLTAADVSERLGVERSTVSRWVAAGKLVPVLKAPGLRGAFWFTEESISALELEPAPDV